MAQTENPTGPMTWDKRTICIGALIVSVISGLAISLAVVSVQLQHCYSHGHRDSACLHEWFGYKNKCFYFSKEERNWEFSRAFCHSHHSSLLDLQNDEKEFLMHFKCTDSLWSGLRKDSAQQWKQSDGTNVTLLVLGHGDESGDCAYIVVSKEANGSPKMELHASRCSTEHQWICSKPDAFQNLAGA